MPKSQQLHIQRSIDGTPVYGTQLPVPGNGFDFELATDVSQAVTVPAGVNAMRCSYSSNAVQIALEDLALPTVIQARETQLSPPVVTVSPTEVYYFRSPVNALVSVNFYTSTGK